MQLQDLDVLKEIPGYTAILKAVLKSQIQMLVGITIDHAQNVTQNSRPLPECPSKEPDSDVGRYYNRPRPECHSKQ